MRMFPYFIMELYKRAKVKEYLGDNWVSPNMPIFPLKIHREGAISKFKNWKIDLGKSMKNDIDPCQPSASGPFEEITSEMRAIRDLMARLAIGLGEPSTTHHFYVAQTDYKRFLANQKELGATISRIE